MSGSMELNTFVFLAVILVGWILPLVGVIIGAFAVFKTKYAPEGYQFLGLPKRQNAGGPHSYVSDLFKDEAESPMFDEDLSEAARRIREQKEAMGYNASLQDHIMEVEGKKPSA